MPYAPNVDAHSSSGTSLVRSLSGRESDRNSEVTALAGLMSYVYSHLGYSEVILLYFGILQVMWLNYSGDHNKKCSMDK